MATLGSQRAQRRQALETKLLVPDARLQRVCLAASACEIIARAAVDGYQTPYKQERLGILLGRVRGDAVAVSRAVLYRGGSRTRTKVVVDSAPLAARIRQLTKRHRLRFLGTFHTHNEVGGKMSSALSSEDKQPLCDEPLPVIEVVATIWRSDHPPRQGQRYFQLGLDGFRIRVASYHFGSWQLLRTVGKAG